MRRRLILAALLLIAPLAGCLGGDEADAASGDPANEPSDEAEPTTLQAPNWSIGDHWTYRNGDGEQTWAVTGQTSGSWVVDTDSRAAAFFDARSDVSFFGERGKTDIAGSQGDTRVQFFDWPLVANKTWTTTWDGVERTITVESVEDGKAHLTARQDGRLAVSYTYDSDAGHFGSYTFFDANGTETFSAELTGSGADYDGTLVRWQLETALDETGTFGVQPTSFGFGFDVPEGATDLWLDMTIDCPSGSYEFGFRPSGEPTSDEDGYGSSDTCPSEADVTGPVVEAPQPGEYRGGFTATSPEADGEYSFTLYVRTLVEVPVGDG